MSSSITISPMTESDVAFATRCTDIENWGYLPDDFRRLMLFEPGGCFVARSERRKMGIVTTTSYGSYGFIGSLIVLKKYRGSGVGELLMRRAIDHLEQKNVTAIELDGVFEAVSLYRRLGFVDKYLSLRPHRLPERKSSGVPRAQVPLLDDLLTYDRKRTSIQRGHILRHYYKRDPRSFVTVGKTSLTGYALVRPGVAGRVAIGPMVADDPKSCRALMRTVLTCYGDRTIGMGVPEASREMVDLLRRLGFRSSVPSLRMYRGRRKNYEKYVRGILSPEKG